MELNKIGYILACIDMMLIFISIILSGSIEADMENNPEDNKSVNNYQNYAQKLSEGDRSFIETKKSKTKSTKKTDNICNFCNNSIIISYIRANTYYNKHNVIMR